MKLSTGGSDSEGILRELKDKPSVLANTQSSTTSNVIMEEHVTIIHCL